MKIKSFRQKQTIYEHAIGFLPEAIILISGGTLKKIGNDDTAKYRSTKINEGDAFGILWGEARTLAVAELAVHFPQVTIIITSALGIREELEQFSVSQDEI